MRLPDWEERLADVIAAYQGGVFVWGRRDCFRLPVDVAHAVAGLVLWPDVRPYRTARGAATRLARHGFRVLGHAAAAVVVVLGTALARLAPAGMTIVPRERLWRAFRVG